MEPKIFCILTFIAICIVCIGLEVIDILGDIEKRLRASPDDLIDLTKPVRLGVKATIKGKELH